MRLSGLRCQMSAIHKEFTSNSQFLQILNTVNLTKGISWIRVLSVWISSHNSEMRDLGKNNQCDQWGDNGTFSNSDCAANRDQRDQKLLLFSGLCQDYVSLNLNHVKWKKKIPQILQQKPLTKTLDLINLMSKWIQMTFCFDFATLCNFCFWHRSYFEILKYHKKGSKCNNSCSIQGKRDRTLFRQNFLGFLSCSLRIGSV